MANRVVTVGGDRNSLPVDTDATMAADSDFALASQKAVKAHVAAAGAAALMTGKVINPDGIVLPPKVQTATGFLPSGSFVQLNHATVKIEASIIPTPGQLLIVTQANAGDVGHTLTTAGTFDGTNNTATFNAAADTLALFALSSTRWIILNNTGSVALSNV